MLEGIPVAIKGELDMLQYTTQVGIRFLGKELAREDANGTDAVYRVREFLRPACDLVSGRLP